MDEGNTKEKASNLLDVVRNYSNTITATSAVVFGIAIIVTASNANFLIARQNALILSQAQPTITTQIEMDKYDYPLKVVYKNEGSRVKSIFVRPEYSLLFVNTTGDNYSDKTFSIRVMDQFKGGEPTGNTIGVVGTYIAKDSLSVRLFMEEVIRNARKSGIELMGEAELCHTVTYTDIFLRNVDEEQCGYSGVTYLEKGGVWKIRRNNVEEIDRIYVNSISQELKEQAARVAGMIVGFERDK